MAKRPKSEETAQRLFKKHNGVLKTSQAIAAGIHPRVLYGLRDSGIIEPIARGLFRLTDIPPLESRDLFAIASKIPKGVICLISALAFHGITTQIPREVSVALAKGSEKPRIKHPPTQFYWISEPAFSAGIETHSLDDTILRVYCLEKTLADCFKFRNNIGLDICLEALKEWRNKGKPNTKRLMNFAKICRVERIIRPYIEILV